MKDNSFVPLESGVASPAIAESKQKTGGYLEIFHNVTRGMLAFFFFGIAPIFIVPGYKDWFEEFGIDVPSVTMCVLQFSHVTLLYWFVTLPLSFWAFAGIEFGILKLFKGTLKIRVNIIYWLVLLLAAGIACLGIWLPCQVIHNGLNGWFFIVVAGVGSSATLVKTELFLSLRCWSVSKNNRPLVTISVRGTCPLVESWSLPAVESN